MKAYGTENYTNGSQRRYINRFEYYVYNADDYDTADMNKLRKDIINLLLYDDRHWKTHNFLDCILFFYIYLEPE